MLNFTRKFFAQCLLLTACFLAVCKGGYCQSADFEKVQSLSLKQPDAALIVLKKMQARAIDAGDNVTAATCLQKMGQICYTQGHFAQALDFYQHADKLFDKSQNKNLIAANLGELGTLYYYNKQPNLSLSLYNKALGLYKQTNNLKGQSGILGDIGHFYEKSHQYDSAFYYQRRALKNYSNLNSNGGSAKIYENLGSIYEDLAKYDSAYSCFNRSLQLYRADGNETGTIEVINNLGDILRKTGRYKESVTLSRQALQLAEKSGNAYEMAASTKDLGKEYEMMGRMDSAFHFVELSRKYSLEIYSKESVNQTAVLQVLYDINKKSDEINRLNNIRKVNLIITAAVVIVVLLLSALGVVVFSRQRLKIKEQHAQARQKEAQHDLVQLELKNQRLEEEGLKQQLDLKARELSAYTLNLIRNNQLLDSLRSTLQAMVKEDKRDQKKQMQQIILQINESFNHDQPWKEFTAAFEQVHQSFFDNLKKQSSDLTSADIRLITLLKINLDSKDMAALLGISMDSLRVSRYRLRKKLNLAQGDNLTAFIQAL